MSESKIRAAVAEYSGWLYVDQRNPRRVHVRKENRASVCGMMGSFAEKNMIPLVALNDGHVWCDPCVEEVTEG